MALRVVFDTNILLSALLSLQGAPFRCLALARLATVESVTCAEILDEFADKLQTKFAYPPAQAQAARQEIVQISTIVTISRTLQVVAADPKDDMVIECAVVGGATHIVTGDRRHLLPLQAYQGIAIISAATLLQLVPTP
jgi:putative PIN family toxin of toxin-antitoxin system